jgi:hypothetical protein
MASRPGRELRCADLVSDCCREIRLTLILDYNGTIPSTQMFEVRTVERTLVRNAEAETLSFLSEEAESLFLDDGNMTGDLLGSYGGHSYPSRKRTACIRVRWRHERLDSSRHFIYLARNSCAAASTEWVSCHPVCLSNGQQKEEGRAHP